jgi:hypothetical protein
VIVSRRQDLTGKTSTRGSDGVAFDDLAADRSIRRGASDDRGDEGTD